MSEQISSLRRATKPTDIPKGFESTITPVLGHEVHALDSGVLASASTETEVTSSQEIVLLHGALASRRYLIPTAVQMAKSLRVYVPEMPGHGASSRPAKALTIAQQADVLAEWFKHKQLKATTLYANSYGCQVAAKLIKEYPELVGKLILAGPTCDQSAPRVPEQVYRLYQDGAYEPKHAQGQLFADIADMSVPIAWDTCQYMLKDDIRHNLPHIKCPAMIGRGEMDPIAPQKWTDIVTNLVAGAQSFVIPKGPHSVNFANPLELTNLILKFISAH